MAKQGLKSLHQKNALQLPGKRQKAGGKPINGKNIHKQILSEIKQDQSTRKKYIIAVEKLLEGRPLVSFFTSFNYPVSIDDSDCDMLQSILQTLDTSKGLALMISTPGGDGLAAERIVNTCRAYSGTGDYWAIVPGKAKSAGTIVAMGASKIIMAPSSELGPVDPQIFRVENGQKKVFSAHSLVTGYDRLFNEATAANGRLEPYLQQLSNYDDREINVYRSLITLSENISVKVLSTGMMSGKPTEKIKKAIEIFLNPVAGTHSHGRPIYANEAKTCNLGIHLLNVNEPLWERLYELYIRTEMFVSMQTCKVVESREEAFYVSRSE